MAALLPESTGKRFDRIKLLAGLRLSTSLQLGKPMFKHSSATDVDYQMLPSGPKLAEATQMPGMSQLDYILTEEKL